MSYCYEEGRGTKKDVVKAAELWKKGAEMGNAWAVSRYAKCLAEGKGVEPNPKEAARLFAMCASRKSADPWTMVQIASFYLRGFGVEKNAAKAKEYVEKGLGKCKSGNCNLDDLKKMQKELEGER